MKIDYDRWYEALEAAPFWAALVILTVGVVLLLNGLVLLMQVAVHGPAWGRLVILGVMVGGLILPASLVVIRQYRLKGA